MPITQLAKWFSAIGDAWNRGEAPWAYRDGRSEAVRVWAEAHRAGADPDEALVEWAQSKGIHLGHTTAA